MQADFFFTFPCLFIPGEKEFNNTSISSGSTEQTNLSFISTTFDTRVLVIGNEPCQTEKKVSDFLASRSYNVINLQDPETQECHFDEASVYQEISTKQSLY